MQNRIVLYRDHPPSYLGTHDRENRPKVRFAEVMKKGGKVFSTRDAENVFPFVIETVTLPFTLAERSLCE